MSFLGHTQPVHGERPMRSHRPPPAFCRCRHLECRRAELPAGMGSVRAGLVGSSIFDLHADDGSGPKPSRQVIWKAGRVMAS